MDSLSFKCDSHIIIVAFGGYYNRVGGIPQFEFLNYLGQHFYDCDRVFYKDSSKSCYHNGIDGISRNIDETVEYLKTVIKGYSRVIFMGVSGGGYAAILFGSLLEITSVLAFIPQTLLLPDKYDPRYRDLKTVINNVTRYCIYGDSSITDPNDWHHIRHCENIRSFPNVSVNNLPGLNLKTMRDSGELLTILRNISSE